MQALLSAGERPLIVDVRSPISQRGGRIPGALWFDSHAFQASLTAHRLHERTDEEVIVYCACPNEASAATVAKRLMQAGIARVRPLAADTDTLNRMFALFHGFGLKLAQPAFTRDWYYSWRQLLQRDGFVLGHVAFVEVMAPLFTRASLQLCLPTFGSSRSGWGLDWVWPKLLGSGKDGRIAILDATPVKHTRPVGGDLKKKPRASSPP